MKLCLARGNEEEEAMILNTTHTVLWRKFEVSKSQKELGAFERSLKRAASSCSASTPSLLSWKVHFSLSRINFLRSMGETSLAKSELEGLRRMVVAWSISKTFSELERVGYFKRLFVLLSLQKVVSALHCRTEDVFSLFSLAKVQLGSTPDCDPSLGRLFSYIEAAMRVQRCEFIQAASLTARRDSFNLPLYEACMRYTGSSSRRSEIATSRGGESSDSVLTTSAKLAREENFFVGQLERLQIADCAESLLRYRAILIGCGRFLRDTIFKKQLEVFQAMNALLVKICSSVDKSSLISYPKPSNEGSSSQAEDRCIGGELSESTASPMSSLTHLQSIYESDKQDLHGDLQLIETSNREIWGVLSIELWIRMIRPDRCWSALDAASKLAIASVEYAAIKILLQQSHQLAAGSSKASPDTLLARKTHLEHLFREQVAIAKGLLA